MAYLVSASLSFYIPSESLGTYLIPAIMQASGMSIFRIGKMIGASSVKNHGVHGGPIHHVFPKTYHVPSATLPIKSPPYPGSSSYYDDGDYDDDNYQRQPPRHHKNVVDAHYSEGMHYHYNRGY